MTLSRKGMLSHILPDKAVAQLRRGGLRYHKHMRAISKREWYFGLRVNAIWSSLPMDVVEEIRISDFYAECSQWINYDLPFPVCASSGETLRRWCEVSAHYQTFPELDAWRQVLSFEHFRIARSLGADPTNTITSAQALAFAVEHELTADQMREAFRDKQEARPEILELRKGFPAWVGKFADPLLSMNGNRVQAEYNLREYVRLVEDERKVAREFE